MTEPTPDIQVGANATPMGASDRLFLVGAMALILRARSGEVTPISVMPLGERELYLKVRNGGLNRFLEPPDGETGQISMQRIGRGTHILLERLGATIVYFELLAGNQPISQELFGEMKISLKELNGGETMYFAEPNGEAVSI